MPSRRPKIRSRTRHRPTRASAKRPLRGPNGRRRRPTVLRRYGQNARLQALVELRPLQALRVEFGPAVRHQRHLVPRARLLRARPVPRGLRARRHYLHAVAAERRVGFRRWAPTWDRGGPPCISALTERGALFCAAFARSPLHAVTGSAIHVAITGAPEESSGRRTRRGSGPPSRSKPSSCHLSSSRRVDEVAPRATASGL